MLANFRSDGLDLLARMAGAAALRAGADRAVPMRLAKCEAVDLSESYAADELSLESWRVRSDERSITVTVFATVPPAGTRKRVAGVGRFTFKAI